MSVTLSEQRNLCGNQDRSRHCCHKSRWLFCAEALGVCRDEPDKVVNWLHPWDWATRLYCNAQMPPLWGNRRRGPSLTSRFSWKGYIAGVSDLKENHNKTKAKEVLQKLGGCDTLLRRELRRVISGETSGTPGTTMTFDEMAPVVDFLHSFLHSLSPVP